MTTTSLSLLERLQGMTAVLGQAGIGPVQVAVVLGSGQDFLPDGLKVTQQMGYADIPGMPPTTAPGHPGRLLYGRLAGKACLVLQGRHHWYEGHAMTDIALPVRLAASLGASTLLVTNTAGGLNPEFGAGELMAITDHINLLGANPLQGKNHDSWGPRFPDMSEAYSRRLLGLARAAAQRLGIPLRQGVYAGVPGPSLETPAETRMLRLLGADAVGMSTVAEVIVAAHAGLTVFGLSVIANVNRPECMAPIEVASVLQTVRAAAEPTRRLLGQLIRDC